MPQQPPVPKDGHAAGGPLRRLLPASPPPSLGANLAGAEERTPSPSNSSAPTAAGVTLPPQKRRRQATTAACGACRRRKSKCNGERPRCSVCRDRQTECEFDTNITETHTQALKRKFNELQSQKTTFEQLFEVLQTRPEQDAIQIFQRIRGGADIHTVLRYVNYGDPLVQLSVVPETRYRFEFPFATEMPPDLLRSDNPYLDSDVYEFAIRNPPEVDKRLPSPASSSMSSPDAGPQLDPYTKPFHSATDLDQWLDAVKPSRWTSVSNDDGFMRKLLHEYFLHEYEGFTFFHKDFFLQDMAHSKERFCSGLLVNAVLCFGCHCHRGLGNRSEHWNPKTLGYQFLAETKRLFEYDSALEKPRGSPADPDWKVKYQAWALRKLNTIQAALLLALMYAVNGSDKVGWRYTLRALEMAYEIDLFQTQHEMNVQVQCVWDYTAWAVFIWQSLNCWSYFRAPLRRSPPESALPYPAAKPGWYGECWVRYPLSPSRFSTYHPELFKAKADLWIIINDYSLAVFGRSELGRPLPISEMFWYYRRLVSWLENLPEPLTPRKIVFPHQMLLHMQYNLILIGILKPIMNQDWSEWSEGTKLGSPRQAYHNAVVRFETVIRLYYLRHGFDAPNSFLVNFFGQLGQMALDQIEAIGTDATSPHLDHLKSTILLVAKGLYDQSKSYYVALAVFRLKLKLMQKDHIELLKNLIKTDTLSDLDGPLKQPVQSDWPAYARSYQEEHLSLSDRLEALSLGFDTSPLNSPV